MTDNNDKINSVYNRLAVAKLGTIVPDATGPAFRPFSPRFLRVEQCTSNDAVTVTIAGPETNRKMWLKMATQALNGVEGVTVADGGNDPLVAAASAEPQPAGP